ncbi:hypothetical protein [Demequina aurantiaca]|uniref:hypothetical protein n=1 Tax=Demequina aurantiaca TaxID=676200 RepID=UPI003D33E9EB
MTTGDVAETPLEAAERHGRQQREYFEKLRQEQERVHARVRATLREVIPGLGDNPLEPSELANFLATLKVAERKAWGRDLEVYELIEQAHAGTARREGAALSDERRQLEMLETERAKVRSLVRVIACVVPLSALRWRWIFPGRPLPAVNAHLDAIMVALELRSPSDRINVTERLMGSRRVALQGWIIAREASLRGLIPVPASTRFRAGYLALVTRARQPAELAPYGIKGSNDWPAYVSRVLSGDEVEPALANVLGDDAALGLVERGIYPLIGSAIAAEVGIGVFARRPMLDAAVVAMASPGADSAGEVSRLTWESLHPDPRECRLRAGLLWSVVSHGTPRSVLTALDSLATFEPADSTSQDQAQFGTAAVREALSSAVARGTKASASRAWAVAQERLEEAELTSVALAALEHPHVSVVGAGLTWLEAAKDSLTAAQFAAIREAETVAPKRLAARFATLTASGQSAAPPTVAPPRLALRESRATEAVVAWASGEEFASALGDLAIGAERPATLALLIDGLQRWDVADCGEHIRESAEAYLAAYWNEESSQYGAIPRGAYAAIYGWVRDRGTIRYQGRDALGDGRPRGPWEPDTEPHRRLQSWLVPNPEAWLHGRLVEAVWPSRQRRPSFDLPSKESGVIEFDHLVARLADAEERLGDIRIGQFEWWHTLSRLSLEGAEAGIGNLAKLRSGYARDLVSFVRGDPQRDVAKDAWQRRRLAVANPDWGEQPSEGYLRPTADVTYEGDETVNARADVWWHRRARVDSPSPTTLGVESVYVPRAYQLYQDVGWRLVSQPFTPELVSAWLFLCTVNWGGATLRVAGRPGVHKTGDDFRDLAAAAALRTLRNTTDAWGPCVSAYLGRMLTGLTAQDSIEVIAELPSLIHAGLDGDATGRALGSFVGRGGSGLKGAGIRLQELLDVGGDPRWVCEVASAVVKAMPEPHRDCSALLNAWASAASALIDWRPEAGTREALVPYARGSSGRARAAREIAARCR